MRVRLMQRSCQAVCVWGVVLWAGSLMAAQFEFDNFRDGLAHARQHDVPLLLHFYSDHCPPCVRMEQTVFSNPQLQRALAGSVVLVKVHTLREPNLTAKYNIVSIPSDVFIDPQGRVLRISSGFSSLNSYVSQASQVGARYRQSRDLLLARNKSGNSPVPYATMGVKLGQPGEFPETIEISQRDAQDGLAQRVDSDADSDTASDGIQARLLIDDGGQSREPEVVFTALDGYCPVQLKLTRSWVAGSVDHSYVFQQQRYRFEDQAARDQFIERPDEFAPRLLGCDPVLMWERDRALPGSTEFAAYYDGQLYLFTSEENREMFRIDPTRYVNLRHVLAPRDVEATLIR